MKDDRVYLLHIRDSISRIADYTEAGREAFMADPKTQDAVLRNLERGHQTLAPEQQQMFSKLRAKLGLDQAVAVNVGAAPTPLEVLEFFHAIGIPVGELWGLSETCGGATCNPRPARTSPRPTSSRS